MQNASELVCLWRQKELTITSSWLPQPLCISQRLIKAVTDSHLRIQDQAENSSSRLTVHSNIFFPNISDFLSWLLNAGIDNLHCLSHTDITLNTNEPDEITNWSTSTMGKSLEKMKMNTLAKWTWTAALHQPCKEERESRGRDYAETVFCLYAMSAWGTHSSCLNPPCGSGLTQDTA